MWFWIFSIIAKERAEAIYERLFSFRKAGALIFLIFEKNFYFVLSSSYQKSTLACNTKLP